MLGAGSRAAVPSILPAVKLASPRRQVISLCVSFCPDSVVANSSMNIPSSTCLRFRLKGLYIGSSCHCPTFDG